MKSWNQTIRQWIYTSAGISTLTLGMISCNWYNDGRNYPTPDPSSPGYRTQPYLPYYGAGHHNQYGQPRALHPTEPSHHFAAGTGVPVKHKDRDAGWVQSQDPQAYTLEIARDQRPEVVAESLHNAPKNARQAQIKVGDQYEAIYGSYPSREAAEAARDQLPASLRDSSQVKQWANIQESVRNQETQHP